MDIGTQKIKPSNEFALPKKPSSLDYFTNIETEA